ncbi:MAG: hypothetical protein WC867_08545 [Candidatus Pacearchaeota archaeon]|jgi:hypothetical protein
MEDKVDKFLRSVIFVSITYCSIGAFDLVGGIINCYRNRCLIQNSIVIKDFNEAERVFNEEKKKLGLDDMDLNLVITDNVDTPGNLKIDGDKYLINISNENLSKEVICHELYHLNRWKSGSRKFLFPIFRQYEEYLATSYSISNK